MDCINIPVIKLCTKHGDTCQAEVLNFDVDITQKVFLYECRSVFAPNEVIKKQASYTIVNGMFFAGTQSLVIEAFKEFRRVGKHTAAMKCIDQDGENTIVEWEINVTEEDVTNADS